MASRLSIRSFNHYRHRLKLAWSYKANLFRLKQRIKKVNAVPGQRLVIAISQVVHLGDIVACEPVIRQIRRLHPESFIIFATHHRYRELVDLHPEVNHVLPLTCIREWAWFTREDLFDHIVDLNIDSRMCELCGMSWHKPEGDRGVTASNYYNFGNLLEAYCNSAGLTPPTDGPKIFYSKKDRTIVDHIQLPRRFVVIHAGSNEADRELPLKLWRKVVSHINGKWQLPIIEIGQIPLVISSEDRSNRTMCGMLSICQSAEVIRRCALFLSTDSGPAHLANAVNAFGIIALGHYRNFHHYVPFSGDFGRGIHCELLHHEGRIAEIPIERIIAAIDRRLSTLSKTT